VHTRYGPPDVVRILEVAKPAPGDNELLIKVYARTVNRTDCHYRAAKPFVMRLLSGLVGPKATVLGTEFAEQVAAVGSGVTSFKVGDVAVTDLAAPGGGCGGETPGDAGKMPSGLSLAGSRRR